MLLFSIFVIVIYNVINMCIIMNVQDNIRPSVESSRAYLQTGQGGSNGAGSVGTNVSIM